MTQHRTVSLKVVPSSTLRKTLSAPPVLNASSHTVAYTCGNCQTVLLHAEENQVHGVMIKCTECGSYNSTDN